MACFLLNKSNITITIPKVEEIDKVSFYEIFVKVGTVSWKVKHRYSDFVNLNDKLVIDHCVNKDILPPKKIIGKRDPVFVEKRRVGLENYLMSVITFLRETMPRTLAEFLDFHKYDILFLLQDMSSSFLRDGDSILLQSKRYQFNPLQLHAISERLKQPCPPAEMFDKCYDFSHVLDVCCQLETAEVEGSWDPVGTSDIIPNNCAFELSVLKDLKELTLTRVAVRKLYHTGTLRQTLRRLVVSQCRLQSAADVLLCDAVHKECGLENPPEDRIWQKLEEVDLSQNNIKQFDNTLLLMPNVKQLTANENQITQVDNFTQLSGLTHLYLSGNSISNTDDLHLCLSNIVHLDLSQNMITSLAGFSRLSSLQGLDLGSNIIPQVSEVQHIQGLAQLDYLVLTGNPVSTVVDYRIKVCHGDHFT
uniref:PX domain-containing protein n=1 Tax=Graphocephala atropunctata TaxID=36148 RepID=A0A1B6MMQ2_9HEMI